MLKYIRYKIVDILHFSTDKEAYLLENKHSEVATQWVVFYAKSVLKIFSKFKATVMEFKLQAWDMQFC